MTSHAEDKSVTDLVRELLDQALATRRKKQLERTYAVLDRLNGAGPKGIRDASTTIDEALYGEHGSWKGMRD